MMPQTAGVVFHGRTCLWLLPRLPGGRSVRSAAHARFTERLADWRSNRRATVRQADILRGGDQRNRRQVEFLHGTNFDVDAVFGTHVCTDQNDDCLNGLRRLRHGGGQVCDELEVDLHRADGGESVPYTSTPLRRRSCCGRWRIIASADRHDAEDYSAQLTWRGFWKRTSTRSRKGPVYLCIPRHPDGRNGTIC